MTVYAVGNFGRAKRVGQVVSSMRRVAEKLRLLGRRAGAVLFCNEIDEGDKTRPSDHNLLRDIFKTWVRAHMGRKDPILTLGLKQRKRRWFKAAPGVPHQSPSRQINESVIPAKKKGEPATVLLGGHYPAGAYNGERPEAIRRMLVAGYDSMQALHAARIQEHHRAGNHVVWGMDCNNRHFDRLHRAEVQVAHHGPDYIRVVPAPGWVFVVDDHGEIPMDIEKLHPCLWVDGHFEKEKP